MQPLTLILLHVTLLVSGAFSLPATETVDPFETAFENKNNPVPAGQFRHSKFNVQQL